MTAGWEAFEVNPKGVFFTRALSSHISASYQYKSSPIVVVVSGADQEKGIKQSINLFYDVKGARSIFSSLQPAIIFLLRARSLSSFLQVLA